MNNKFLFISFFTVIATLFGACSSDGTYSEAEVSFQGVLTSVDFSDQNNDDETPVDEMSETEISEEELETEKKTKDGYDYTDAIAKALADMNIIGEGSVVTEKARADVSEIAYAQIMCYNQALPKLNDRINAITFEDLMKFIYKNDTENMNSLGYFKPEDIPLTFVKAHVEYQSATFIAPPAYDILLTKKP